MRNDDELLEMLGDSLRLGTVEPTPSAIAAVRLAAGPTPSVVRRRRARRVVVAALVASVALVGGPGVAYAFSGDPIPSPVRQLAHAIGLPVQSPQMTPDRRERDVPRDVAAAPTSTDAAAPTSTDPVEPPPDLASTPADSGTTAESTTDSASANAEETDPTVPDSSDATPQATPDAPAVDTADEPAVPMPTTPPCGPSAPDSADLECQ